RRVRLFEPRPRLADRRTRQFQRTWLRRRIRRWRCDSDTARKPSNPVSTTASTSPATPATVNRTRSDGYGVGLTAEPTGFDPRSPNRSAATRTDRNQTDLSLES